MKLLRLKQDTRGAVLIELGMILPMMFLLLSGLVEVSLMISTRFKVSGAANQVALPASVSGSKIDEGQLTDALDHMDAFVAPIDDFDTDGKIIVAAVQGTASAGTATIMWNRCMGGLSLPSADSVLAGADDSIYNMPDGLTLGNGLTAVVVQVSYKYKPLFLGDFMPAGQKIITKTYVQRSRYGEFSDNVDNGDTTTTADDVPVRNC
jgi:Flp pilus assembly protein TadG